jgi:hypothetical protein
MHAESEQAPEGAPDSEQYLSGAPSDCPMAPSIKAPTVEVRNHSKHIVTSEREIFVFI